MPGVKPRQPRPRTRDQTQQGDAGVKWQVQRAMRQAMFNEEAQALVAWGVRQGLLSYPSDNDNTNTKGK